MIDLDYESTSLCDIGLGGHRYAADPSTRILMFCVATDEGEPLLWRFDDPFSDESMEAWNLLDEAIRNNELVYAHNATQFEVPVSINRLKIDTGIEPPSFDQWRCTLAMCRRAAAPESLEAAAEFFGLEVKKDGIGKALIGIFSDQNKIVTLEPPPGMKDPDSIRLLKNGNYTVGKKPKNRKSPSPILDKEILWDWMVKVGGELMTVRRAWDLFCDYCKQDVRVQRALRKKLSHFELKGDVLDSYQFDLRLNCRGVPVNVPAIVNAERVVAAIQEKLAARFERMCGLQPSQRDAVQKWLQERGYPEDNLQAGTVETILENPPATMSPLAVEVLRVRSLVSFSALAKLPTMREAACADGRVRGTLQWHAARTMRPGGRLVQPQNMKKATIDNSEVCYSMICQGFEPEFFEEFWDSPLEAIASCIRHFIQPLEGELLDADYTGVEARITPWLAGDVAKLQLILAGVDLYKRTGSFVFGVPYDEINKEQRTAAKPIELGCCIAEGEMVLTRRGLIEIENVLLDDLVWDGVEWVSHEGVIFQGYREVITYQGLSATEDHDVWVEERTGKTPFGVAVDQALHIVDSGTSRTPIQRLDIDRPSDLPRKVVSQGDAAMFVRDVRLKLSGLSEGRDKPSVRQVPREESEKRSAAVVGSAVPCGQGAVPEPGTPAVRELRGPGHRVQVQVTPDGGTLDDGQPWSPEGAGDRPKEQRRALRSGEHALGQQERPDAKQPQNTAAEGLRIPTGGVASVQGRHRADGEGGEDPEADLGTRSNDHRDQEKELASNRRTVRVYDLLNAGPRHRFTVSGKLVSNCFGVGGKGLRDAMGKPPYNIQRTLKECRGYVKAYRDNHPETVQAWKDIEAAAHSAIASPGKAFTACDGKLSFSCGRTAGVPYLTMRLPSGRRIYYPHPKVKDTFKPYDEEEMQEDPWKREEKGYWIKQISFYGKMRDKPVWGRVATWGSRLFENAVQAIGADLFYRGCNEAERRGFPICMIVHDQALCETSKASGTLEEFIAALCTKDEWAADFPLEADGAIHPYYLKES